MTKQKPNDKGGNSSSSDSSDSSDSEEENNNLGGGSLEQRTRQHLGNLLYGSSDGIG